MKSVPVWFASLLLVACSHPQLPQTQSGSRATAAVAPSPVSNPSSELTDLRSLPQSSPASLPASTTEPDPNPVQLVKSQPTAQTPINIAQANSTEVPITLIAFAPAIRGGEARGVFIVPDRDTTRSAYGGKLRRYDVHLAKMFEISNLYCNPDNGNWNRVEWNYFADAGRINMGKFRLDCNEVRQVVAAYGLGRPESTTIYYYGASGKPSLERIPVLDLNGYKIDDFLNFVQTIKPIGDAQRIDRQ